MNMLSGPGVLRRAWAYKGVHPHALKRGQSGEPGILSGVAPDLMGVFDPMP